MIAELGHYLLVLACIVAFLQFYSGLVAARVQTVRWEQVTSHAAIAAGGLTLAAFLTLVTLYVRSDFSVANVWQNSHTDKPLIYKISGTWGNHEGSMLLWVLVLAIFSSLTAVFSRTVSQSLKVLSLAVQGLLMVAFFLFILLTSNPFARMNPAPMQGRDLNPLLQDIGLAIHPPLLYLGYVGFSVAFSYAAAALIEGRFDSTWARAVKPWVLIAWIFLTLGISMGSYWAYYELGWGGWWFWDPVENASLMPWILGTALLHSVLVMEKRDALKVWSIFLAIVAFAMSLLGTFLVRSGVLTSVHAFATDPARGVFILAILVFFIAGAFALFAFRVKELQPGGLFHPISREGALVLNNLFLAAATTSVCVGTLYPLVIEAINGNKISVGAPFFNLTVGALMLPLFIAMPFGTQLAWKRGDILAAGQRLMGVWVIAALAMIYFFAIREKAPTLAPVGAALALFMALGSFMDIKERTRLFSASMSESMRRAKGLPLSSWGVFLAHLGMAITVGGIAAQGWEVEKLATVKKGDTVQVAHFSVKFETVLGKIGPNYTATAARFSLYEGGTVQQVIEPAKRVYKARNMPTTEAGIATFFPSQFYITLAEVVDDQTVQVKFYWKPFVLLIWLGSVIMALGGVFSLSDRRYRIGGIKRGSASQ